jgi:glycosyltransferase
MLKVSLITVCYNNVATLADTVESVLGQTYPDIEYILVDGASTDGTLNIIEPYRHKLSKVISEPDDGMYFALNKGLALATGDIVGIIHADDVYAGKQVIEAVANCFQNPSIQCVYGDLVYVSKNDLRKTIRYWKSGNYDYKNLKWGWMPPHPTFFVRNEIYRQFGQFDTTYKIAADYDLMMRFLGQQKIQAFYLPEVLVKMRLGGASNKSIGNIIEKMKDDYRAIRKNRIGGIYTLIVKNLRKIKQFYSIENGKLKVENEKQLGDLF